MKAIIISDADARALLDKLELESLKDSHPRWTDANPPKVGEVHKAFHYIVCRWLQEQGADVVGRG
jgi:hypothetical protein